MDEKMDEERMGLMGDWMCGQLMVDDVLKEGWMEGVSFKSITKGKLQLEIEIRFFCFDEKKLYISIILSTVFRINSTVLNNTAKLHADR